MTVLVTHRRMSPKPGRPSSGVDAVTPEELAYLRRIMDANEQQSFRSKLEDMGEEDCDVCRANRLRDAWESDKEGRA